MITVGENKSVYRPECQSDVIERCTEVGDGFSTNVEIENFSSAVVCIVGGRLAWGRISHIFGISVRKMLSHIFQWLVKDR